MVIEKVDKTIETLCERIQKEAETSICIETVPDIVKSPGRAGVCQGKTQERVLD